MDNLVLLGTYVVTGVNERGGALEPVRFAATQTRVRRHPTTQIIHPLLTGTDEQSSRIHSGE